MPDDATQPTVIADRYELQGEIGRGGMGAVYRAKDRQLERLVALKLVAPALAGDGDFQQRLLREAHALARIKDSRVVSVYDAGVHEGRPWFVMELCTDGSLAERMPRGQRLEPGEVRVILGEVAGALAAIHEAGIVHRDLKPANIFRDGRHWKVGDFGIASAAGTATITQTGMIMGTPEYWAPELAMADAETGPEADVYSLGCVLYQALAGQPPFSGPNALRLGVQHAQDPVPPLPPEVSQADPELAALVMRMLAKEPHTRPTVPELLGDEAAATPGGAPATVVAGAAGATGAPTPAAAPPTPPPAAAPAPGSPPAASRPNRKPLWIALVAGVVVIAAVIGGVIAFTGGGGGDGDDPPEMADGMFLTEAEPQLDRLTQSGEEIESLLARIEDPSQLDDFQRAAAAEVAAIDEAQRQVGTIDATGDERETKAALQEAVSAQRDYTAAVNDAVSLPPADGLLQIPAIEDAANDALGAYGTFFSGAPEATDGITGLDLGETAGLEATLSAAVDQDEPAPEPEPTPDPQPDPQPDPGPMVFTGDGFSSPTGNLNCNLRGDDVLICARSNDGLNVTFDASTGEITDFSSTPEPGGVTVPYGSDWEGGQFRCDSEQNGITCTSFTAAGGFFLSRDEFRLL